MNLRYIPSNSKHFDFKITGSKSISNRYLILQAIFPKLKLTGLSNSDDTQVLQKALSSRAAVLDIHHAGTAMRFLTAYLSSRPGLEVTLTGSSRMQERPIGILVEAMRELGADIQYEKSEGFPPLKIKGTTLTKDEISISANVSSQYITALMLIAPSLSKGLSINMETKVTSRPYLKMTAQALRNIGVKVDFDETQISIQPKNAISDKTVAVESDWSSASYFYSCLALQDLGSIELSTYYKNSLQGDSKVAEYYKLFGIHTEFQEQSIRLSKMENFQTPEFIELDLNDTPDLAQTIAVTCLGLGVNCLLTGLHTLKVKETDRLVALKHEIEKFGADVEITSESLHLKVKANLNSNVQVKTYQDHRMAMAFAPLAIKTGLQILEPGVVSKSFPSFWEEMKVLGIS